MLAEIVIEVNFRGIRRKKWQQTQNILIQSVTSFTWYGDGLFQIEAEKGTKKNPKHSSITSSRCFVLNRRRE